MLIGTGTLPVTMIVGGLLSGLSFLQIVLQSLPVLLFCFLLMFGIWRFPEQTVRAFTVFADVIRLLTTIGLIAGAFCYMTGFSLLRTCAAGGRDDGRLVHRHCTAWQPSDGGALQRCSKAALFIGRKPA